MRLGDIDEHPHVRFEHEQTGALQQLDIHGGKPNRPDLCPRLFFELWII